MIRRFLMPDGHVDAAGYHDYDPDGSVPQVVFGSDQRVSWLGMKRLAPDELLKVKRNHVVEDLLNLNDGTSCGCLLSAAALAPLLHSAPTKSRPLIWLKGTDRDRGKPTASTLIMNFFGELRRVRQVTGS